ncbi:inositol monophosphatase [Cryomorphaceae bacterium]|nr:inositol monophosphatase [Cryomorphaceae bacterium]
MSGKELQDFTLQVAELAKRVGQYIEDERVRFNAFEHVERKSFNSLVSYVDKTAEEQLVEALGALLPEAGFVTEEGTAGAEDQDYLWIIDPLDGTTNYIHGIPCYAVSIGLTYRNKLLIGVVYEITKDENFYAWKDGGAYLNGKAIQVSPQTSFAASLYATGFPYYDFEKMRGYLDLLAHLMQHSRGIRRLGSAATDLAYVACGRFEGFYEYGLSPWDVAGGSLLVMEAGGIVTDFSESVDFIYGREIISANAHTAQPLTEALQKFL